MKKTKKNATFAVQKKNVMPEKVNKEKDDQIEKANRYVDNAKVYIANACYDKDLKHYTDSKYVKTAGSTLWKGCLIALDAVFGVKKGKGRPSIEKYEEEAGKRDKKLLIDISDGYNIIHLSMGYDGIKDKEICDKGFRLAEAIIKRCATMYNKA